MRGRQDAQSNAEVPPRSTAARRAALVFAVRVQQAVGSCWSHDGEREVGMGRVEWSALGGEEVETLLSNLMYNRHERAQRVRPAQGDFGIDILLPVSDGPEQWDVYQVKKFASNLDASQKGQIEKSFRRILLALVRRKIPVRHWYLVTPLDPTLHNLLDWFKGMPARAVQELTKDSKIKLTPQELDEINAWLNAPGRHIEWKGLNYCESLAADHPYVVDYYLHGGRERLREAVADVAALLRTDMSLPIQSQPAEDDAPNTSALITPGDVQEHLYKLDRVLDTDPHYRYGISLDLNRPDLQPEPRLVAATQERLAGDRWLTFKIYQRSAQSLDERPIPLDLKFRFEDPDEREAFEIWLKYGKPTELTASFSMDLPGGVDAAETVGRVRLSPAEDGSPPYRSRLRVVEPSGMALAALAFAVTSSTGQDGTGLWAHGQDDSGTLVSEFLLDLAGAVSKLTFNLEPLAGKEASKVEPAVAFASHLAAPNRLQVAAEYGPFSDLSAITASEPLADQAVARFVEALATIQTATATRVVVPDVAVMSVEDRDAVRRAAALINGQTLVARWTSFEMDKHSDMQLFLEQRYDFRIEKPLTVRLNGETLILGTAIHTVSAAAVAAVDGDHVRIVPEQSGTMHITYSAAMPEIDGGRHRVQYRPLPTASAD